MRSLSLLLAAFAFTGCAPAQTTRTTYVHEIVVVETRSATAQTGPRRHEPRGWALGHRDTPASPGAARSVSVVSVEQQVLIETAPRQTDNPIPTRSAFIATQRDTPRPSLDEKKRARAGNDNGRTKGGRKDGMLAPSTRTKRGAERDAKENATRSPPDRDAQRREPERKHDADRWTGLEEAKAKRGRKGDATRRARSDRKTKGNRKSEVAPPERSTTRVERGGKRGAKKNKSRRREARSKERARQRLAKEKTKAKERRSAQKPAKKSFEALARR